MKFHGSKFTGHLISGTRGPVAIDKLGMRGRTGKKKKGLAVSCNHFSIGAAGFLDQSGASLGIWVMYSRDDNSLTYSRATTDTGGLRLV